MVLATPVKGLSVFKGVAIHSLRTVTLAEGGGVGSGL